MKTENKMLVLAMIERDVAEAFARAEGEIMVRGSGGEPCGRIISIDHGSDRELKILFTVNPAMRDILIDQPGVEFSIGHGTRNNETNLPQDYLQRLRRLPKLTFEGSQGVSK